MADTLGVLDYVVFLALLTVTVITGLYHGVYKGGQTTTKQFLLADRKVFSIPVALTIIASFTSPVTLLGVPSEVYIYGPEYMAGILNVFIMLPIIMVLYAPVFCGLNIVTSYQYLDIRYGYPMRVFGGFMFICQTVLYTAIVLFTPALAIEAVTGFDLWLLILLTGVVCTFYTSIGGLSAVIWTDAFMAIVILTTIVVLIITGTKATGDFSYIWEVNENDSRTDLFQFPLDMTERFTFPNLFLGSLVSNLSLWGVSQTAVQRFLSAKSLSHARISLAMNFPLLIGVLVICSLQGLVMYAYYFGPDAVDGTNRGPPNMTSPDQITVYFVSEQFGDIPGYLGLYISCLVAGSLSTISSNLNAMSAVVLIDILRPFREWRGDKGSVTSHSEKRDTTLSKVLVFVFGVVSIALSYLCVNLDTLISLINTIFGAVGGPLVASFSLGMLWPRANTYGTLIGAVTGFLMGVWATVGSYVQAGQDDMFGLYKISFQWYSVMTLLTTLIVSVIMSEFFRCLDTEDNVKEVDPALLATFIR
ncbi:Sodium-dependent multivitamin transporter [Holothuria leucospilota]|uniref:Sodium-dependent multivitamin transporter n=1 Tax=Holothuria leucospilota TaxID=206669 RepID=A0A9Q1BS61_HOLLE|nr:Sodium-dependent multivitamin transporter [Holothuria leucospilota]